MNTPDPLAQALDACLEQTRAGGLDARAALAACPEGALAAHHVDDLAPLLDLAVALDGLPKVPPPSDAFRDRLAVTLAAAPAPRSLARREADPAPASHPTSELVLALDRSLDTLYARPRAGRPAWSDGLGRNGPDHGVADAPRAEVAEEIDPLLALAAALQTLPPIPGPSETFRARLAADLEAAPVPRSIQARQRPKPSFVHRLGLAQRLWRSTAFSAAAAATVVLLFASSVVYASASALPGQVLYPVKRATERMQVWLAPDDAVELHLGLANRRLQEALWALDQSGGLLADFSGEVTAALVAADYRMAARVPRAVVAPPLLAWLIGARVDLVGGRPKLPPTAWRASLALVDEAIAALQSGETLAVAPVPRLGEPGRRLARAMTGEIPRLRPAARLLAPAGAGSTAVVGGSGSAEPRQVAQRAGGTAPSGVGAGPNPPSVVAAQPLEPPPPVALPVASPVAAGGEGNDEPTSPGTPSGINLPPNTPTAGPTLPPSPTAAPPTPTSVPAEPTATPTDLPPVNKPPEITAVSCSPAKLPSGTEATCTVDAADPEDPEGGALTFAWYVNPLHGLIDPKTTRETKLQVNAGSGYEPVEVTIRITVTDAQGNAAVKTTVVTVVPFLENRP